MGTLIVALACVAQAQDYPAKPIRLITPAAQGGTTDLLARLFGAKLTEVFKQQVIVDNRASASGVIAGDMTAKAPPDGYTLLLAYHQHTINAALNPNLPYHPVNDFTPITQLTRAGLLLVVNPASPPRTLQEFIEWTKSRSGELNFGSAGLGSGGHLAGELYKQMTGVRAQHIPYKGSGPAMVDLMGGRYDFNFAGLQGAQVQVRAGKLRALAVTTPQRIGAMPDIPAVAEAIPRYEVVGWYGVIGPAGMPLPIVARLHEELVRVLAQPGARAHRQRRLGARRQRAGRTPRLHGGRSREVGEARQGERCQTRLKGEKMNASFALLASFAIAAPAAAQSVVNEATVSTDAALQIATAALAQCRGDGQKVTVSVVDHAGREKVRVRDDGAAPHTEVHSFRKAYTAATYRIPSAEYAKRVTELRAFGPVLLPNITTAAGGVPIRAGDRVIGAVGISGRPASGGGGEHDAKCAEAGIAKVRF